MSLIFLYIWSLKNDFKHTATVLVDCAKLKRDVFLDSTRGFLLVFKLTSQHLHHSECNSFAGIDEASESEESEEEEKPNEEEAKEDEEEEEGKKTPVQFEKKKKKGALHICAHVDRPPKNGGQGFLLTQSRVNLLLQTAVESRKAQTTVTLRKRRPLPSSWYLLCLSIRLILQLNYNPEVSYILYVMIPPAYF